MPLMPLNTLSVSSELPKAICKEALCSENCSLGLESPLLGTTYYMPGHVPGLCLIVRAVGIVVSPILQKKKQRPQATTRKQRSFQPKSSKSQTLTLTPATLMPAPSAGPSGPKNLPPAVCRGPPAHSFLCGPQTAVIFKSLSFKT